MQIRVLAVGTRMPAWVDAAVDDYTRRLSGSVDLQWREIRAEPRSAGGNPAAWMRREAGRIDSARAPGSLLVVLDERGTDLDTAGFAQRLRGWQEAARPVTMLIGGPDGLDPSLRAQAAESIRLSSLTLAHPLVRVVLAEQLYRAWSLLAGHPYHRA
jgi:23S rRNA (pseudouridine1915-N3)-methyltransferase